MRLLSKPTTRPPIVQGKLWEEVNTRQQEPPPPSPKTKYETLRIQDVRIQFPILQKSVWIESGRVRIDLLAIGYESAT